MSKIVTLKTDLVHRFNKGVILAGIEVNFDQFGMVEVAERHAENLIAAGLVPVDKEDIEKYAKLKEKNKEFEVVAAVDHVDENIKLRSLISKLEEENKILKEKLVELQKLTVVSENDKKPEDLGIDDMTIAELKKLCKESDLPKEEWNNLKEAELKSYVKGKIA